MRWKKFHLSVSQNFIETLKFRVQIYLDNKQKNENLCAEI